MTGDSQQLLPKFQVSFILVFVCVFCLFVFPLGEQQRDVGSQFPGQGLNLDCSSPDFFFFKEFLKPLFLLQESKLMDTCNLIIIYFHVIGTQYVF